MYGNSPQYFPFGYLYNTVIILFCILEVKISMQYNLITIKSTVYIMDRDERNPRS